MVRGILMSKEGQKAILLTRDGSFQKVRLKKDAQVTVGQTVLDSDIALRPAFAKKIPMSLAACLTVILVFSLISGFVRNNAIAAYVSFDVNPSIEAAINQDFRVVEVKGLNKDGKALLATGIKYKDMPLREFSLAIADALSERGYLSNDPDVVVSTTLTEKVGQSEREDFLNKLNQQVSELKNNHTFQESQGTMEVFNTTMDRRKEATKAGISTGKYLIYLKEEKNNNNGKKVKLSQVKQMTVKELRHKNVKTQETVQTTKSHPKNQNSSNKKPKKKNNHAKDEQKNDDELFTSKVQKLAQPKQWNQMKKKGNPHMYQNDLLRPNGHRVPFPAQGTKIGPQNNHPNQKPNKGNHNHKNEFKKAG